MSLPPPKLAHQVPFCGTLPSLRSNSRRELHQRVFTEQVRECMDNGYLLSSKKIGSGAFSKVYLAYATRERMKHNPKLFSDLRGKHHTMVAIKIVSTAEAPVEYSRKFLPREILSLNATYKHLNIVQLYETYQNSQRSYLVLELAARGDLLEHINAMSDLRCCPGLEEEEARRLFWQLVSAVAHCHNAGIVHRDLKCENILLDDQGFLKLTDFGFANCMGLKNSLLSTFCGSVAYTAPEILMSKKYNGEQADLWSLGIILHAMVSGKLPFKEHQPPRMLQLIRRGPIFRPGLSPEQEHSQSAIGPGNTEPRGDMVYQKQKLQHLQRQVISKESVSCPAVQHLETCTRGIGFTSLGLWHTMAGGCTLRPTFPNRNMPGHYLVN
ncbi:hypothetical protein ACRRTK_023523 [Alexandromys fortis]